MLVDQDLKPWLIGAAHSSAQINNSCVEADIRLLPFGLRRPPVRWRMVADSFTALHSFIAICSSTNRDAYAVHCFSSIEFRDGQRGQKPSIELHA